MEKFSDKLKFKLNKIAKKWDVYIEQKEKNEVLVNDGKAENKISGLTTGFSVRLFKNNKMAYCYGSGNDFEKKLNDLKFNFFIEGYENFEFFSNGKINKVKTFDENLKNIDINKKINVILETEKYAKGLNKKVKFVRDFNYSEEIKKIFYENSNGFKAEYEKTTVYTFLTMIFREKTDEIAIDGVKSAVRYSDLNFKNLVEDIGERGSKLLNGKSVKSGYYDVVLPSRISSEFISFIAPLFFAENIRKKKSLFCESKSGEKIASEKITIKDDALFDYGTGSFPFDGEGNSGKNKLLVENGILKGFLYDNLNAILMKKEPTGNSIRQDFKKFPECGASNFYIEKSNLKKEDVLNKFSGIVIDSLMGLHTIDTVSGNFSLGMNGWLMKNGKILQPIKETLITGNLKELLKNIEMVGDDLEFYFNFGSPTLFIKNVLISGKE